MALTPETGAGLSNADSLCSLATATAYHASLGNAAWAALADDATRENMLRRATIYMGQVYRDRWHGVRVTRAQALDWPRSWVMVDGYPVAPDIVPVEVQRACAELALRASSADLAPDIGRVTSREKVDVIEVEYFHGVPYTQFRAVDALLAPYLTAAGGGASVGLVRT